jgi:predicted nuclease of predicted toxin-antitoxin system
MSHNHNHQHDAHEEDHLVHNHNQFHDNGHNNQKGHYEMAKISKEDNICILENDKDF